MCDSRWCVVCVVPRQVDEGTDFRTKSILCMPIKNVAGKVIGVIQLVNKMDNTTFNKNDENLFEVRSLQRWTAFLLLLTYVHRCCLA